MNLFIISLNNFAEEGIDKLPQAVNLMVWLKSKALASFF